jgi:hemerythrin superfamily protein
MRFHSGTAIAFLVLRDVRAEGDEMATARKAAKKTVARKAPASAQAAMSDATLLLARDHAEVRKLFRQYEQLAGAEADGGERRALAQQICTMPTPHATLEEEIFYPAARDAGVDGDLLDEAEVEHASAKELIAQIEDMDPDDDLYNAKVTVLGEYVDHHVQEEEGEMFPKCRKAGIDLAEVALQLSERRQELMEELGEGQPA